MFKKIFRRSSGSEQRDQRPNPNRPPPIKSALFPELDWEISPFHDSIGRLYARAVITREDFPAVRIEELTPRLWREKLRLNEEAARNGGIAFELFMETVEDGLIILVNAPAMRVQMPDINIRGYISANSDPTTDDHFREWLDSQFRPRDLSIRTSRGIETPDVDPAYANSLISKAVAHSALQQSQEALEALQEAFELNHSDLGAHLLAGNLYYDLYEKDTERTDSRSLHHLYQAIIHYRKAVSLDPENAQLYYKLGRTRFEYYKRYEVYTLGHEAPIRDVQAIVNLTQAIALDPTYVDAHYYLGLVFSELRMYPEAIKRYKQVTRLDDQHKCAFFERAKAHYALSDYEKAKEYCDQALGLDGRFADAWSLLAYIDYAFDDFQKVVASATRTIELSETGSYDVKRALQIRGCASRRIGEPQKAVEDFNQCLEVSSPHSWGNPELSFINIELGAAYIAQGQYPKAIAILTEAIKLDDRNARAYIERGWAFCKKGDYKEALEDLTQAFARENLQEHPLGKEAHCRLGHVNLLLDNRSEAIRHLDTALTYDPGDKEILDLLERARQYGPPYVGKPELSPEEVTNTDGMSSAGEITADISELLETIKDAVILQDGPIFEVLVSHMDRRFDESKELMEWIATRLTPVEAEPAPLRPLPSVYAEFRRDHPKFIDVLMWLDKGVRYEKAAEEVGFSHRIIQDWIGEFCDLFGSEYGDKYERKTWRDQKFALKMAEECGLISSSVTGGPSPAAPPHQEPAGD